MIIIDAHSHLWLRQDTSWDGKPIRSLKNGRSIFLGEEVQMMPPFMIDSQNSAEVYLSNMDYAQVGAAVVVQEFIDGLQNDYLEQVQRQYPDRFLCCGMPDYRQPGFYAQAEELILQRGFRGIAIPGHRLLGKPLTSDEMMQMFRLMEQGMANPPQTPCWENPSWRRQIALAQNPHVMIEMGGITWLYNAEFYPFPSAVRAIREVIDIVGADKLMWGSDYPRTITAITYRMSYDFLLKSAMLSDADKRLILGENACRFYGFTNLPELPYIKNMSE